MSVFINFLFPQCFPFLFPWVAIRAVGPRVWLIENNPRWSQHQFDIQWSLARMQVVVLYLSLLVLPSFSWRLDGEFKVSRGEDSWQWRWLVFRRKMTSITPAMSWEGKMCLRYWTVRWDVRRRSCQSNQILFLKDTMSGILRKKVEETWIQWLLWVLFLQRLHEDLCTERL